jgi:predicted N-formylglutamate amidohydrolase
VSVVAANGSRRRRVGKVLETRFVARYAAGIMETCSPEVVRKNGEAALLLLCDHASNRIPPSYASLGLSEAELGRHIAYDIGARGLTLALSDLFDAPAVLSTVSRLVIDPNRGEDDPTLVMKLYDGAVIPGNRDAGPADIRQRLQTVYRPYHDAVSTLIDRAIDEGATPSIVSLHSFTPQLRGRSPRPWHVGVLWDRDDRIAAPLLARLRAEDELVVGDNQPYTGRLTGDCMWRHGTCRGLPHVLIEVRNDLIADAAGQAAWAALLGRCLADVLDLDLPEAPAEPAR